MINSIHIQTHQHNPSQIHNNYTYLKLFFASNFNHPFFSYQDNICFSFSAQTSPPLWKVSSQLSWELFPPWWSQVLCAYFIIILPPLNLFVYMSFLSLYCKLLQVETVSYFYISSVTDSPGSILLSFHSSNIEYYLEWQMCL